MLDSPRRKNCLKFESNWSVKVWKGPFLSTVRGYTTEYFSFTVFMRHFARVWFGKL